MKRNQIEKGVKSNDPCEKKTRYPTLSNLTSSHFRYERLTRSRMCVAHVKHSSTVGNREVQDEGAVI